MTISASGRFNIRVRTKLEAVAVCGCFIQAEIECEGLKAYSLDDNSKYPAFLALE